MKEVKRLIRCENGHFFDGGKYDECPHCNNKKTPVETIYIGGHVTEDDYKKMCTVKPEDEDFTFDSEPIKPAVKDGDFEDVFSDSETIKETLSEPAEVAAEKPAEAPSKKPGETEPVVGWLVCVDGVHKGEDFRIKRGRNFIGRASNMDIVISGDQAVSRDKHAILTYDPKGVSFFLQPGLSSELSYVNQEAVLVPTKLKSGDRITLGDTELIFVPFCSRTFTWEKKKNSKK